jgi:hypothetical protein
MNMFFCLCVCVYVAVDWFLFPYWCRI